MDNIIRLPNMISTLQTVGCHFGVKPPGWRYERHHHFLFEILHCREGEVTQIVGQDALTLRAGDWLLIKSGIPHETINEASGDLYRYFNVHFDLDEPKLRELLCSADCVLLSDDEVNPAEGSAGQLAELETIMSLHGEEGEAGMESAIGQLRIQVFLLQLIGKFADKLFTEGPQAAPSASRSPATTSETEIAREMERLLKLYYARKGAISEVARTIGLSRSQCTKIFHNIYGQSPRQYVSALVLSRAKHLLVYSTLTMERIAEELGFESASQFSRQFRRWTGMAPSHYRPRYESKR
ncbi:AraC family transcriptional regulator [Paenibacillus xanthanilyticus]|uniref:Helix-turn-helix domain-containing protein n=1 Tax=Paenibacillus xanthanilyticus TaxID=1783531 RepID=A0ABV8JWK8_9BACL